MTVFVIDIKKYYDLCGYTLEPIEKLCEFNDINLYVLNEDISQNTYNLHPSWLKLFAFDLVDDDFIVTWDLDLVPTRLYDLKTFFDLNSLNFCYDKAFLTKGFTFNGKFKYNCGLGGIPRKYAESLKKIYIDKGKNATYPAYEQYYINDWIFDNNIKINLLDSNLNYMFEGHENFNDDILNIHYTWQIKSLEHRLELVKKHSTRYAPHFNLKLNI